MLIVWVGKALDPHWDFRCHLRVSQASNWEPPFCSTTAAKRFLCLFEFLCSWRSGLLTDEERRSKEAQKGKEGRKDRREGGGHSDFQFFSMHLWVFSLTCRSHTKTHGQSVKASLSPRYLTTRSKQNKFLSPGQPNVNPLLRTALGKDPKTVSAEQRGSLSQGLLALYFPKDFSCKQSWTATIPSQCYTSLSEAEPVHTNVSIFWSPIWLWESRRKEKQRRCWTWDEDLNLKSSSALHYDL